MMEVCNLLSRLKIWWEEDLFEAGFEVGGSYNDKAVIKDTENREMLLYKEVEFKGRYVFDFTI